MPTYEYECKMCGHTFDVFQSMSDTPLKTCPKCGKEVRRLINGGSGVIFKGSGFYVTDKSGKSAGRSGKPEPAADKSAGAESGTPSAAKSETGAGDKPAVSKPEKAAG